MSSKVAAHDILADLSRVHKELGRVPTRPEYNKLGKFSGLIVIEYFGSYAAMVTASGLHYAAKGKRNKQDLRRQHFDALQKEVEEKRIPAPPPLAKNLLIIPDLHAPYHHPDAMEFLRELHAAYKFDTVVNTGDEIDGHAWSFHDKDPDALSPGHELEAAIKALEPLYKLFPKMRLAESNHGSLIHRRAKHFGLPQHVIKSYREIICAPGGWEWDFEIQLQMSNGKRLMIHHAYSANALRASQQRGVSVAFGHHHSQFSIQYWRNYEDVYFAAFAGSLVDEKALAMEYGKNLMQRPIPGALIVLSGVPDLRPMHLDKYGRWTGKL